MMGLETAIRVLETIARIEGPDGRERHVTRSIAKGQPDQHSGGASTGQRDVVNTVIDQDPRHYDEAMKSEYRYKWCVAMTEELEALKENDVWEFVVPPRKAHVLHNKWVH